MGKAGRAIQAFFKTMLPERYSWPAMDVQFNGSQFHLVGSIHMGTCDMMPLPCALQTKLCRADALIVEADIMSAASPFDKSTACAPLERQIDEASWQRLSQICHQLNIDIASISSLPAWQVALMLQAQQAQQLGLHACYGIDHQLLNAAHSQQQPVIELEGAEAQLSLLEALPVGGVSLLEDTLLHWQTNARLLQIMISWWLDAPPASPDITLPTTFCDELSDLLIHDRNVRWAHYLRVLPPGNYLVAVGALHLFGENNLIDLLKYP